MLLALDYLAVFHSGGWSTSRAVADAIASAARPPLPPPLHIGPRLLGIAFIGYRIVGILFALAPLVVFYPGGWLTSLTMTFFQKFQSSPFQTKARVGFVVRAVSGVASLDADGRQVRRVAIIAAVTVAHFQNQSCAPCFFALIGRAAHPRSQVIRCPLLVPPCRLAVGLWRRILVPGFLFASGGSSALRIETP